MRNSETKWNALGSVYRFRTITEIVSDGREN